MSAPAFAPERREIWYSDGFSGFYVVRALNGVWPFTTHAAALPQPPLVAGARASRAQPQPARRDTPNAAPAQLAATGTEVPMGVAVAMLALGAIGLHAWLWKSRA
jgi:hypothetical protein